MMMATDHTSLCRGLILLPWSQLMKFLFQRPERIRKNGMVRALPLALRGGVPCPNLQSLGELRCFSKRA